MESKYCRTARRFGDAYPFEKHRWCLAGTPLRKLRGKLGCDVTRNRFRRWIHTIKRRSFVEIAVAKRSDNRLKHAFNLVEITKKFLVIESISNDRDDDPPIVPMKSFTNAIEEDRMGGGELALNLKRELDRGPALGHTLVARSHRCAVFGRP